MAADREGRGAASIISRNDGLLEEVGEVRLAPDEYEPSDAVSRPRDDRARTSSAAATVVVSSRQSSRPSSLGKTVRLSYKSTVAFYRASSGLTSSDPTAAGRGKVSR